MHKFCPKPAVFKPKKKAPLSHGSWRSCIADFFMLVSLLHCKPPLCRKGYWQTLFRKLVWAQTHTHPSTNNAWVPESSRKKNADALNSSWKRYWKNWSYKNVCLGPPALTDQGCTLQPCTMITLALLEPWLVMSFYLFYLSLFFSVQFSSQGDHTPQNIYTPLFQSVTFFSVRLF